MTETATTAPQRTPEERFARFRRRREEVATAPQGFLALTNTQWVDGEQPIWGVPGVWAPLPAGESGLRVRATAADGIRVDGVLVDGEAVVAGRDSEHPGEVVFDDHTTGYVIAGPEGSYALRVWDSRSEALENFGSIDAFDYDPSWIRRGRFTPNPDGTTAGFEHMQDDGATRELPIPGEIVFEHDGTSYAVLAFQEGRSLQLVFSDATSGDDTYSVGRFLFVTPDADGTITLDFNTAVLPPCAFSYNFNCPMPPKQNRFPFRIDAGEKNVLAKDGSPLH